MIETTEFKNENEIILAFQGYTAELVQYKNDFERLVAVPKDEITESISKEARTLRLAIKKLKAPVNAEHKRLKAPITEYVRNLDGTRKEIIDSIKEKEAKLEAIEKYAENKLIEQKRLIGEARARMMSNAGSTVTFDPNLLAAMEEEAFSTLVENTVAASRKAQLDKLEETRRSEMAALGNDDDIYNYRNMSDEKYQELKRAFVDAKEEKEQLDAIERQRLDLILPLKSYWALSEYNVRTMSDADFSTLLASLQKKSDDAEKEAKVISDRRVKLATLGVEIPLYDIEQMSDKDFKQLVEEREARIKIVKDRDKQLGTIRPDHDISLVELEAMSEEEFAECVEQFKLWAKQEEEAKLARLAKEKETKEKEAEKLLSDKERLLAFADKLAALEVPEVDSPAMKEVVKRMSDSLDRFIIYIKNNAK